MISALDYAKAQKRNGHIALGVTIAVLIGTIAFIYLSSIGVVRNMSLLFVFGLITIVILFGISTALFYNRFRSMNKIIENPLVHWKYNNTDDIWLNEESAEAIISDHGIYYSPASDRLHTFWNVSSKLESLKIGRLPDYDYTTMNFFFIKARTFEGNTISAALHVPVPKGQEELAEKLVEQLTQNLKLNKMKRVKMLAGIVFGFIVFLAILVIVVRSLNI
jgi:hypothetical protein